MKIVVAIDSFKGSLTSLEGGECIAVGIKRVYPDAEICIIPIADGGEGTVEALTYSSGSQKVSVTVHDPLMREITAEYGITEDKTAVIEMASASGLPLLKDSERNPFITTTFGVGEMIKDAIKRGCRNFIIGLGGSATNDGGVGMLSALGVSFRDKEGKDVEKGGLYLRDISKIEIENIIPELSECSFSIASDVKNTLCGPLGASEVYARQKGADDEGVRVLDESLYHFAKKTAEIFPESDMNAEGTGAAGGLGFAFLSYLPSKMERGIDLVLSKTGIEQEIKNADLVITGEGRLDAQTAMGKAPIGVSSIAKKYKKSTIAFSGAVTDDAAALNDKGIDAFFPILRGVVTLEEALEKENAKKNMTDTAEQVFRLIKLSKQ